MVTAHDASGGLMTGVPEVEYARTNVLECVIVTPEATVLEHPAQFVVLPLFDGELGVSPHHTPLIGRLGFGELRFTEAGQTRRYYIDGGFVQVADNVVSVLTPRAVPVEKLDGEALAEQLQLAAAPGRQTRPSFRWPFGDRTVSQLRAQLHLGAASTR